MIHILKIFTFNSAMNFRLYNYLSGLMSIVDWQASINYDKVSNDTRNIATLRSREENIPRGQALMAYFQERRAGQVGATVGIISCFALAAALPVPMWCRAVVAALPLIMFSIAAVAHIRLRDQLNALTSQLGREAGNRPAERSDRNGA